MTTSYGPPYLRGSQGCKLSIGHKLLALDWQGRSAQILKTGLWMWEWHLMHGPSCFLEVYSRMFHSHSILLQSIHSTQCFTHYEISPPFPPTTNFPFQFSLVCLYDSLYFSTYYLDSVNLPLLGRTSVFSVKVKTLQQVDAQTYTGLALDQLNWLLRQSCPHRLHLARCWMAFL